MVGRGALALGGIFLVAYAAQQGLFTPMMRLWSAVTLGVALIGASEWLRRSTRDNAFSHPLVAALLAGAGAATLYGAVWGAHGLYQYIDWATAALALGAIVVLLLGLALLHGEAIGILAIVAGLLAPLLTTKGAWPESSLSLYIAAVTVTGYMLAGLRRWPWLAGASMLGAFVWYAISFSDGETLRALVLLGIAAIGGCALAFSPMTRSAQSTPNPSWDATVRLLPALGIVVSSVLLLALWYVSANTSPMRSSRRRQQQSAWLHLRRSACARASHRHLCSRPQLVCSFWAFCSAGSWPARAISTPGRWVRLRPWPLPALAQA
ncbi:MAG: DUF2339 domain-containing protein [Hyphomonadaceae bacterium JAD_PAG50586_4]|nr:MAG: DUF2339 domain-containing protein [Hyphomonadaceae bacterium JAD_PAG50586_4]